MRIRQVKPEFFGDADMAALPFRTRLTYIGLWQEADDAGWLVVDAVQIAHDLYGFDPRPKREAWVVEDLVRLQEAGCLEVLECGHGVIPTLPKHQKSGGRPVYAHRDAHARGCARMRADGSDHSMLVADGSDHSMLVANARPGRVRNGMVGNGRERNGMVGNGSARIEEPTTIDAATLRAMRRQGLPISDEDLAASSDGQPFFEALA
jgi:hypothetical protein